MREGLERPLHFVLLMFVCGWESYYTTTLGPVTASTAQPDVDWRQSERARVLRSRLWLLPTSGESASLKSLTICQWDTSVPCSRFFVLIESSLGRRPSGLRRLLCAQFQSRQKEPEPEACVAVCGTGVPQMIIDWGQCRVGMSEVKWLYPGADNNKGEQR